MTKKRQIAVAKKTDIKKLTVTSTVQVDATDVPHTQLFVNRKRGDEDSKNPEYMISHKYSGWGLLSARCTKKVIIGAAQFLWSQLPNEIVDLLSNAELESKEYNNEIKKLYKKDSQYQKLTIQALNRTKHYIESQT